MYPKHRNLKIVMNVTIENFFCPYCDEVIEIYFRIINTILFSGDENALRIGIESLKQKVPLDEYFEYGYGAHHFWVYHKKNKIKSKQYSFL